MAEEIEPVEFDVRSIPCHVVKVGDAYFPLASGDRLKIETSPQGSEILDLTVPDGKSWNVTMFVRIEET